MNPLEYLRGTWGNTVATLGGRAPPEVQARLGFASRFIPGGGGLLAQGGFAAATGGLAHLAGTARHEPQGPGMHPATGPEPSAGILDARAQGLDPTPVLLFAALAIVLGAALVVT